MIELFQMFLKIFLKIHDNHNFYKIVLKLYQESSNINKIFSILSSKCSLIFSAILIDVFTNFTQN